MDAIFKRTSIRKYEDREVEPEKVERILRAAMAAPSAGNQQPWEFYVVRDKAVIERLSQCSPYAGCAAGAPMVIVVCTRKEGLRFPELTEVDLGIATENILLEATELGLGAVFLAVAPFENRIASASTALGIGEDAAISPFALVPMGYPAQELPQQDRYDAARVHTIG